MLFNLAIRLIRHTSIDEISTHGKCLLCNQYGLWLWNAHNIVQLKMRFVWRWVLSLSNKVALRIPISMAMQYVWCGLKAYSHGKLHENGYFQVNAARVSTSLSFYIFWRILIFLRFGDVCYFIQHNAYVDFPQKKSMKTSVVLNNDKWAERYNFRYFLLYCICFIHGYPQKAAKECV